MYKKNIFSLDLDCGSIILGYPKFTGWQRKFLSLCLCHNRKEVVVFLFFKGLNFVNFFFEKMSNSLKEP